METSSKAARIEDGRIHVGTFPMYIIDVALLWWQSTNLILDILLLETRDDEFDNLML